MEKVINDTIEELQEQFEWHQKLKDMYKKEGDHEWARSHNDAAYCYLKSIDIIKKHVAKNG